MNVNRRSNFRSPITHTFFPFSLNLQWNSIVDFFCIFCHLILECFKIKNDGTGGRLFFEVIT